MPSFYYERKFKKNFNLIGGVDEAGRGPLAGPVLACALILNKFSFKEKIDDSKKLSFNQRARAYREIIKNSHFAIGAVGEKDIDRLNIRRATLLAMEMAITDLIKRLTCARLCPIGYEGTCARLCPIGYKGTCAPRGICFLIDGNVKPAVRYHCENIVNGDSKSLSIACASIVAKVTRDSIMRDYHHLYPQYGFVRHKGYATPEHLEALSQFGHSPIHRRSFQVKIC